MSSYTRITGFRWLVKCLSSVLILICALPTQAADVLGTKKVMVLRVYFHDYAASSRYTKAQVEGFFGNELNQLWKDTSYNRIDIAAVVTDLFQLPDNRSEYIDDDPDGDLSNGGKYMKVLSDAVAASPASLDWSNVDQVMVVMAETSPTQFHRGQGNKCTLPMGPGGSNKSVGCAIFSENPSDGDVAVWGRWAHEMGHAFQQAGPVHPSNYNNAFELMDASYPGQTGPFEKQAHVGFPGWLPGSKYQRVSCAKGGETSSLHAMEYDPITIPNAQALKVELTSSFYYMVSVRRKVRGDDVRGIPDEGVIIERVNEGADPWVKVIGRTAGASCTDAGCNRNTLWQEGDQFGGDGIVMAITKKFDPAGDNYAITVRCNDQALQPDVMLQPWTSPPGNTWETTDIWIDSPVNGYGNYRYGTWSDLLGSMVPQGNGDNPAIGQTNRLYARVRNVGTQAATNVVVNWEVTDPLGLGIAGANGWAPIGSVNSAQFPALANIPAGGSVDVYVEWAPSIALTPEQVAAGTFALHSCVRVKLNGVPGELVLGNQDGEREQENISYFESPSAAPGSVKFADVIHLHNPDFVKPKTFYLNYKSDVPADWSVDLNNGKHTVELDPGQMIDLPIVVKPGPSVQPVGARFTTDVSASNLNLLQNDLDPTDRHPEFKPLGGVQVDARVLKQTKLNCKGSMNSDGLVTVDGRLKGIGKFYPKDENPLRIQLVGIDEREKYLDFTGETVVVGRDGKFSGRFRDPNRASKRFACLFAGTDMLMSASSGPVPLDLSH